MTKKWKIGVVAASVLLVVGFTIFRLVRLQQSYKDKIPYLVTGEKIDYFQMIDSD